VCWVLLTADMSSSDLIVGGGWQFALIRALMACRKVDAGLVVDVALCLFGVSCSCISIMDCIMNCISAGGWATA